MSILKSLKMYGGSLTRTGDFFASGLEMERGGRRWRVIWIRLSLLGRLEFIYVSDRQDSG